MYSLTVKHYSGASAGYQPLTSEQVMSMVESLMVNSNDPVFTLTIEAITD